MLGYKGLQQVKKSKYSLTSDTKNESLALIVYIFGAVCRKTTVVKSTVAILQFRYGQNIRVIHASLLDLVVSV